MKTLIIIDMQNDFVTGSLGNEEAVKCIPYIIEELNKDYDNVYWTRDTHTPDYLNTLEGKFLPVVHCVKDTEGWEIVPELKPFVKGNVFDKPTFGSLALMEEIKSTHTCEDEITFVGVCTDICVASNVLLTRAALPNTSIKVVAKACAGVTVDKHNAALETMRSCQVEVL